MQIDGEDIEILFGNVILWGIFTKNVRDKKKHIFPYLFIWEWAKQIQFETIQVMTTTLIYKT